ncbi:MAG: geranylgeranylglyceryl/heptaprenylglyceryl phosphate synthase [Acidilobaceae archaeon]
MEVHVALDVYKNKVVRMIEGKPENVIVYSNDPLSMGLKLLDSGLKRIHLVDLEATIETGKISENALKLAKELKSCGAFVTIAGGIRSFEDFKKALDVADRVVVGTGVHKRMMKVEEVISAGGDRAVLALDVRSGRLAISGWKESLSLSVTEGLNFYSNLGFRLFLLTDVERDGKLSGPNAKTLVLIPQEYRGSIIYAGGISSINDVRLLAREGFRGVVVGRAFYEGTVTLEELLEVGGS